MNIAVLMTCYNRKDKTCKCLQSLFTDLSKYNNENSNKINLEIFLVDDGSTDNTSKSVQTNFPTYNINIINGTGSLYWAGGMRLAWDTAYKKHSQWDFYFLLNDDTELLPGFLKELLYTHDFSLAKYNIAGIYSGITCASNDNNICTYGGTIWTNKFKGTSKRLGPSLSPQMCNMTNANILLVHSSVVDKIGRFSIDYQHGMADYDYSIRARKKGIPALITSKFCGICDNDHTAYDSQAEKIMKMSLKERIKYFSHPLYSSSDYLKFIWNTSPLRWPIVWFGRMLNIFFPSIYYMLNKKR